MLWLLQSRIEDLIFTDALGFPASDVQFCRSRDLVKEFPSILKVNPNAPHIRALY